MIRLVKRKSCKKGNEKLRMRVRSKGNNYREFHHEPKGQLTKQNFRKVNTSGLSHA